KACALDQAEAESVICVVTPPAQTAAHLTGHGITDENSRRRRRGGESVPAKRRSGGPIAVQRALKAAGEVLAGQRLLVLGLVAASAFAVPNRLREVGMRLRRVALPATNSLSRVAAFGVVRDSRPRVAGRAVFDIGDW